MHSDQQQPCPCGSAKTFENCCQQVIQNDDARTTEILMRSRYSAYVMGNADYLLKSWHSSTRPDTVHLHPVQWLKLQIQQSEHEHVTFSAFFKDQAKHKLLTEKSRFSQEHGHWRYLDGQYDIHEVSRNETCPCGSLKKYKRCCAKALK
ncbi:MAG: YchJ family metal-binding protein [Mariprofundaceae bacterium]|nr:YchJ family metal-binding protein [Mariprofundaceae bacterium]